MTISSERQLGKAFQWVGPLLLAAAFCLFHAHAVLAFADCSGYSSDATCETAPCGGNDTPIGPADNCTGICCLVRAAPAPTANQGTTQTPAGSGVLQLVLPTCIKDGNCSLDDIVTTGANFANLLTQLSAALFFATFVYGGGMYLLSFGDKSRVEKGKKAIVGAAIGMAIVLGAWTLVNYIANSLLGKI